MKSLSVSALVVLFGVLVLSCSDSGNEVLYQSTSALEDVGKVSLLFADPPEVIREVVATLTRTGYPSQIMHLTISDSTHGASGSFTNVVPGLWHLRVEAKDSSHVVRYSGETDVQVVAGQTANVTLQLLPGTGGNIHITVTWGTTLTRLTRNWQWTRDGRGGGSQQALQLQGDSVVILPVAEHVHFVNRDNILGSGTYRIKFKGNRFLFGWRISPQDSTRGTGLILQDDSGGMLAFIRVNWEGFFYGFHNAPNQFRNRVAFPYAGDVWHEVIIRDTGNNLFVAFDGQNLNFFPQGSTPPEAFFAGLSAGYQGLGNGTMVAKYFDLEHSNQY